MTEEGDPDFEYMDEPQRGFFSSLKNALKATNGKPDRANSHHTNEINNITRAVNDGIITSTEGAKGMDLITEQIKKR